MSEAGTPLSGIGGKPAVRRMVKRCCDFMNRLPEAYRMGQGDAPPAA